MKAEVSSSQYLVNPLIFNMEHHRGTHSISHALTTPVQGTVLGWDSRAQWGIPMSFPLLLRKRIDEDTEKRG